MSLIGNKAPLFTAPFKNNDNKNSTVFSLQDHIGIREIALFIMPYYDTFLYSVEHLSIQKLLPEFEKRNVYAIGVYTYGESSNLSFLSKSVKQSTISTISFPLLSDTTRTIATDYGVLSGHWDFDANSNLVFEGVPTAYYGAFLIDKQGIVRHEFINFFSLSKAIHDILLVIDGWQVASQQDKFLHENTHIENDLG